MSAGRLAEALAAHEWSSGFDDIWCSCGVGVTGTRSWPGATRNSYRTAHLAAVVLELLDSDEVQALAARELRAEERNASMSDHDWGEWEDAGEAEQGAYLHIAREQLTAIRTHLTTPTKEEA